ncbi:MAG: arylsulfatase [Verrucomicrobiae bacterium]|nr:arylsulfatase [Verrucomicrobiae bacterium]
MRVLTAMIVLWTLAGEPSFLAAASPRPNILLILADDLGFSDTGCYGGEILTPHLDALAARGLRFTQFYNTSRCWPSRAALLTGYYAQQIRRDTVPGVRSGPGGVRPTWAPLLPVLLRPAGYRSYHAGKWHLDGGSRDGGFDRSYRIEDHDRYFGPLIRFEDDRPLPPVEPGRSYYTTTAIVDRLATYLEDHVTGHPGQPFFAYLAFMAPHFPLQAPSEDIVRVQDRYGPGWDVLRAARARRIRDLGLVGHEPPEVEAGIGPPYDFSESLASLGAAEVRLPIPWTALSPQQRAFQAKKMAIHAAMIERMDLEIGRLMALLNRLGVGDNTLVLFLSDNGASAELMVRGAGHDPAAVPGSVGSYLCLGPGWSGVANTPFRRHKTWVHEGGIATPLIASWPAGIPGRGELRRGSGHVIDVVPTLLELAGVSEAAAGVDEGVARRPGRSLIGQLKADIGHRPEPLWWQHEGNRALRLGDWKIVASGEGVPWELYDLAVDRGEVVNLAVRDPGRVRDLDARWTELRESFIRAARGSP